MEYSLRTSKYEHQENLFIKRLSSTDGFMVCQSTGSVFLYVCECRLTEASCELASIYSMKYFYLCKKEATAKAIFSASNCFRHFLTIFNEN